MIAPAPVRVLGPTGLRLWQRCPRRFWFEHVVEVAPDHAFAGFAVLLGLAGHAGARQALRNPDTTKDELRDLVFAAFEEELARSRQRGLTHDPDAVGRALDTLENEVLDLVWRLGRDERVRRVQWTHTEAWVEWPEGSRRLGGVIDAAGVAREWIPCFGEAAGEPVELEAGTRVLVDWKFGKGLDLTSVGLALDLQLAFYRRGAEVLFPGEEVQVFLGAVRDLLPRRPTDARGRLLPRRVQELNPAYLTAFADGRPVTASVRAAAQASRRRLFAGGKAVPKHVSRPNPDYLRQVGEPRGPLFHQARLAWPVVRATVARTLEEIDAATRSGEEAAFPARGPATGACTTCPFRRQCVPGTACGA